MVYPLSSTWNETLKKTEEAMKKAEDFYTRDEPMMEIDKVRGVEHAYYDEKAMKEAEEALAEAEEEGTAIGPASRAAAFPDCSDCDGSGKVPSGHGMTTCPTCNGSGIAPEKREEEEITPLDAGAVKQALDKAFVDASDLVKGLEEFTKDVENLDMDKIDDAIELINNVSQTLKDAKAMGYPVEDLAEPEPSSDIFSESRAKEPEKSEA